MASEVYASIRRKLGWRFTACFEYRTAVNWPDLGPAKIRNFGRHFYVFSDLLYQELLVCYIQMFYIILKLNFLWVSASELDETFVTNWCICPPKIEKKWWTFRNFMEIWKKTSWIWKIIFEVIAMKEILRRNYKWGDLLYEFPAETRLTVYRRLDIYFITRRAEIFLLEE